MDSAGGDQTDVKVGEADGDQTRPGQEHVSFIQKGEAAPGRETGFAEGGARKTIKLTASEVAERVTRKSVEREHDDVHAHDDRAEADTKVAIPVVGDDGVVPEEDKEQNRKIKEITVNVLKDKGKPSFAPVFSFRGLPDRASRRIEKKSAVIRFAVVVARGTKTEWSPEDEQRG